MLDRNRSKCDSRVWPDQVFRSGIVEQPLNPGNCSYPARKKKSTGMLKDVSSELVTINEHRFGPMIGKSLPIRKAFQKISKTASSNASVIIYGESGTGKELAAQTIHNLSPRRNNRFVSVNCGAIPTELIESEFFGYKKGAFTGANMNKPGYLDWADSGTLFLDEVGELSLIMQVKLLRVVDDGGYTPIGSLEIRKPDIRIIAATNRDLRENVRNGLMREDFYYRINVLPILMPPLRERKDDLPLLIDHFLKNFSQGQAKPVIPANVMALLEAYHWPGNIRELQNAIQRYVTLKEIDFLKVPQEDPAREGQVALAGSSCDLDLKSAQEEFEAHYIARCLEATDFHQGKACAILKINRKTLYKKMQRYGFKKKCGK